MIRFMPDTWLEALARPIAMAVPDGSVYVETLAPDFRFVFALALALALALAGLGWRYRAQPAARRALALAAFCAATFVPWLATSGNGRYFMPTLFVVGPLCVALLHQLPFGRGLKLGLLGFMVAAQGFLLTQVEPWNSWGLAPWKAGPAFAVDVPADLRERPATYVTLSSISYSLVAPRFHPESRWVSLASLQVLSGETADVRRVRLLLEASPVVHVMFPSLAGAVVASGDKVPLADQSDAIDLVLGEHGLRLERDRCRLLPSAGLTAVGVKPGQPLEGQERGFWVCAAAKVPRAIEAARPRASPQAEAALDRIEQLCPRMFPPGTAGTSVLPVGARRFYVASDMRLYALNDGRVAYKYMRALNAVVVGTREEVLAEGFRMDCKIQGRAGLPWEREI